MVDKMSPEEARQYMKLLPNDIREFAEWCTEHPESSFSRKGTGIDRQIVIYLIGLLDDETASAEMVESVISAIYSLGYRAAIRDLNKGD